MPTADEPPPLRIGALAAAVGLNPKTIRYYETLGLLPAPRRTATGYRLYGEADREQLGFILKAKAVGLTLTEIGEVLALRRAGEPPCGRVLALLDEKLAAVDRQLQALSAFRRELVALKASAGAAMDRPAPVCAILERPVPQPA
ncbi:MAG: heavy metal-responsive transcriptional regulator [Chloroflexota bacterium]|nr:heavy metal-responsive transcriptional regulator [Chloroflexota bacterium]